MEVFTAMKERRSCRSFDPEAVERETVEKILEAATWAPSPLNSQPWEFVVVTSAALRRKIREAAESCREWALEKSGWKWLNKYPMDFLEKAPVIVAVTGDPKKSGVDAFFKEGPTGYQHACAAAIQNMQLAAHAMGLSSLWFTFFHKEAVQELLRIPAEKTLVALVCLGKPAAQPVPTPRKMVAEKVRWLENA